jgi:thiol-disulfide isomerase/thioredoxin
MVDWDRVEELRSKGWEWDRIAEDPKVGFHADPSAGRPGRALRTLARSRRRGDRERPRDERKGSRSKKGRTEEARWTPTRIGYLVTPIVGFWLLLAFLAPSPVGILVPAFPYLALAAGIVAFLFGLVLWRGIGGGPRWSKPMRSTLVWGSVLGLVFAGLVGLIGAVVFDCPYLPPSTSLSGAAAPGWQKVPTSAWQENGKPVLFFFGATWCPFCSASSWALFKALYSFGVTFPSSAFTQYSNTSDSYPGTPEVVLAEAQQGASPIALSIAEDTSGVKDTRVATSGCYQQAYVSAYDPGEGIPFVVFNGQYVHVGTIISPPDLASWASGANGGNTAVKNSVVSEQAAPSGGDPWSSVQTQAWWIMALFAKVVNIPVSTLATEYGWTSTTKAIVADYEGQL